MRRRVSLLAVAVCFAATLSFASDPYAGTWKLNEGKSKFAPNAAKNQTVTYETSGDNVKVTIDGTDASGKAVHNEWTGKFDGKDYPVTGDTSSGDARSYKKVNDHTMSFTVKKDGKVVMTGRIVVSADGKTRTVTTTATGADGKKASTTAVYDKS